MSALVIRRDVKIELGIEEIAAAFAELDGTNQAAFFCEVGKLAASWRCGSFELQAELIANSLCLGNEGAAVLRSPSEHFMASERAPA